MRVRPGAPAPPQQSLSLALHAGADRGRGTGCRGEASRPARHADGKPTASTPTDGSLGPGDNTTVTPKAKTRGSRHSRSCWAPTPTGVAGLADSGRPT